MRGGEKKWHHVKRGVPIRLEIGPKDIEKNAVFFARRDQPKSTGMDRSELISTAGEILGSIQQGLFDRAAKLREDNSVEIDNEADFRSFFTPQNDQSEIHGGFAYSHFSSEEALEPLLKELKVTVRCIPRDSGDQQGTCFATGQPATQKAIFAKAY